MKVKVKPLFSQGRLIRARERQESPPYAGILVIREARDSEWSRNITTARVFQNTSGTECDVVPALHDIKLLYLSGHEMRLQGLERINEVVYAQTWQLELESA